MGRSKQDKFLELYEPIHKQFERFCLARVYGNMDHKDLINDTLLIAYEKFETLKNEKALLSFLITISLRILSNNYRKRKELLLPEGEEQFYHLADESAQTDKRAEVHFLYKALAKLNDAQRESLILFEISGFSIKEIAQLHNVSIAATKQRLKRGRTELKKQMLLEPKKQKGDTL